MDKDNLIRLFSQFTHVEIEPVADNGSYASRSPPNHIAPNWDEKWLSDVRTVEVEEWLHSLSYAPATKSKISIHSERGKDAHNP